MSRNWIIRIVLVLVVGRLVQDELQLRQKHKFIVSLGQTIHLQNQIMNIQARDYNAIWKERQKCDPMLSSEGRDVFCHGYECMYLEPLRFPEPPELYMGNLNGENIWTYEQP